MPSHSGKLVLLLNVAGPVAFNLRFPELRVRLWQHVVSAPLVSMPEASVDEDARAVFAHYDIRMTGQTRMVQPIAEATAEQEFSDRDFRFGVFSPYRCHAAVALFLSQLVHNRGLEFQKWRADIAMPFLMWMNVERCQSFVFLIIVIFLWCKDNAFD